jgi:ketosteroid isomerase-like protein
MSNDNLHTQAETIYRTYTEDAVYEHPLMICRGVHNISKAQGTWTLLFHDECKVENIMVE